MAKQRGSEKAVLEDSRDGPAKQLCPKCRTAGVEFFSSKFANPPLTFIECPKCRYRWVIGAAAAARNR